MRKLLLSAAAVVLAPAVAFAQSGNAPVEASMDVKAEIITPLAIATQELDFGVAIAGVSKDVLLSDADREGNDRAAAGIFHISGDDRFDMKLTFLSVPSELVSGENTLPVAFTYCSADAALEADALALCSTSSALTNALELSDSKMTSGNRYVFVGGTITPAAEQASGDYDAAISLRAEYTGI